jgi:hypothetical protein
MSAVVIFRSTHRVIGIPSLERPSSRLASGLVVNCLSGCDKCLATRPASNLIPFAKKRI